MKQVHENTKESVLKKISARSDQNFSAKNRNTPPYAPIFSMPETPRNTKAPPNEKFWYYQRNYFY